VGENADPALLRLSRPGRLERSCPPDTGSRTGFMLTLVGV
jgi:hypothetical protein